jgi:glutamate synthase domain-containing protein 2/glutamate synthase domain-containing protein 1/glutamate synthase domain-containing protein 3
MPTAKIGPESPQLTLYHPSYEHDGCGTGFIAAIDGTPSHRVVQLAVKAVVRLTHRGAVSADAVSGDGAGVTIQVPRELLADDAARLGLPADQLHRLGVAMVFLPADEEHRPQAREILESAAGRSGAQVLGWRPVPIDPSMLGGLAKDTLPGIEQLLVARPEGMSDIEFDRTLYLGRKRAEAAYREHDIDTYVASMSSRTVVYKGLMVAAQLERFFPDLADERTVSSVALYHQRFATNTLPNWKLAQPFRMIGHNGEINTLLGNRNWMSAREPELTSALWGDELAELTPIIWPIGSDSASLDEAFELLVTSGRDLLHAIRILVPEAWENEPDIDPELRAFYEYHACLTEPWDGPAAIAFTDGVMAAAAMDRNGLRPARYQVMKDGLVVMGSEVGMLDLHLSDVVESGRIGPGEMIAVDTATGQLLHNDTIKERLATRRPYGQWVEGNLRHLGRVDVDGAIDPPTNLGDLQILHGYTKEEIKQVIAPMAAEGKEPTGSMGDDTPPSALTDSGRSLYTYFRQRFAQVTNPPIDSIRERVVMSLDTYLGKRHSLLEEKPEAARLLHLRSPLLSDKAWAALTSSGDDELKFATLDALFPATTGPEVLREALDDLCRAAVAAVDEGCTALVLTDRNADESHAPIPMLLAVSTVHHHLIRTGRRMRASLLAEAGDARDVHQLAALIGFGASAVHPHVALASVRQLAAAGDLGEGHEDGDRAVTAYLKAAEAGLLKIMSKMGIAAVASYHGAQIFEALGLGDEIIERCFPGTTSRIGGIGLNELAQDVLERHQRAYSDGDLDAGGWYKFRRGGDYHANEPPVWRALHEVVQGGGKEAWKAYTDLVYNRPPTALRDLLDYESDREAIDIEDVEPVANILARFQTGAMSLGALSRETHEDIARAMNSIGGYANTGEGGEDPRRYLVDGDLRDANSAIKQVASGRFGVTPAYLAGAQELEIKIAQGAKPGEGGQLPGHKVSAYIATLRHVEPGTPLISPPPHHDIYSIEDIAQLIYDLKMANPRARVCVKLVAAEGVGTIAAGVAKAYADTIQISGHDGGTGASPLSSIKYVGAPWELGIAETQQTLVLNGLRGRVRVITDGGLHAGRDIVTGAMLGADRFGFGTTALIALGCKMARQCHSNTCPVGIATQAEELRQKYFGTPEMLVTFLTCVAEEVREILATLGYRTLEDIIGRADLLRQIEVAESHRWRSVDLSRLIAPATGSPLHCTQERNDRADEPLDDEILAAYGDDLEAGKPFSGAYQVQNTNRTIGGRLSVQIARVHGDTGLPDGTVDLTFTGSAGQSFGAWLVPGVSLLLDGEANDYVAKGMHGGRIVIRPPEEAGFFGSNAVLVGNTVMYGATGGELYVCGRAGERFAVRNSGGTAVVEGCGDHGCEYMTSGKVVVLGHAGRNFGAGMSGGVAYVFDADGTFPKRLNGELVRNEPVTEAAEIDMLKSLVERHTELTASTRGAEIDMLKSLVERHTELTESTRGAEILADWPAQVSRFWKIVPRLTPAEMDDSGSEAERDEPNTKPVPQSMRAQPRAMASSDAGPEKQEAPPSSV